MTAESENQSVLDIAIIGAGITGLAAAYEIQNSGEPSLSFELFETSASVGGKIVTDKIETEEGSFLLEQGPDSFLATKPWALELAKQLGLQSELLETNAGQRHVFVLKKGRLQKMPEGMMLMIPTRIWPFILTSAISWRGKLRAALELFIRKGKDQQDESVAHFVQRRFGQEIFEYIAEPLLAGIYNANSYRQSLKATFPQFSAMEEKKGSLIRATFGAPKTLVKSPFISFQNGMETLVLALEKKLDAQIRRNTKLQTISQSQDGFYELTFSDGKKKIAKSVIITASAAACAHLIGHIAPRAVTFFRELRTIASGCIYLAFRKSDMNHSLKGFGFVVPSGEKRQINAVTWVSSKLDKRAPKNAVLLRVFFGGHKNPSMMTKRDAEIENIARQELRQIMKINIEPLFSKIYRNGYENPQYDVGHLQRIENIKNALPEGIQIAGSSYLGVGIPDCVHQGNLAAQKAIQYVLEKSPLPPFSKEDKKPLTSRITFEGITHEDHAVRTSF